MIRKTLGFSASSKNYLTREKSLVEIERALGERKCIFITHSADVYWAATKWQVLCWVLVIYSRTRPRLAIVKFTFQEKWTDKSEIKSPLTRLLLSEHWSCTTAGILLWSHGSKEVTDRLTSNLRTEGGSGVGRAKSRERCLQPSTCSLPTPGKAHIWEVFLKFWNVTCLQEKKKV